MAKIVTQHSDGYFDSLEGRRLDEGDPIYIKWSSGLVQKVEVQIERFMHGASRDGQVVEVECCKAFTTIAVAGGGEARIYLAGFEAQRAPRW